MRNLAQDQTENCWMCGSKADSAEHIFKARDLRRIFDEDGYETDQRPFHFLPQGGHKRIAGPKANSVKYPKIICHSCNSKRTAEHDRSYDAFADWFTSKQACYDLTFIDLADVFGQNFQTHLDSFVRYCAKSLGCRIIASGYLLPENFPNPLRIADPEILTVQICRLEPFRTAPNYASHYFESYLGKGQLQGHISPSRLNTTGEKKLDTALWWENIGHFQLTYTLNLPPHPTLGSTLDTSLQVYPLTHCKWDLEELNEATWEWCKQ